jgi:hypothetical protein
MNVLLTEAPVSWDDYRRVLSWITAWANVTAWVCKVPSMPRGYGCAIKTYQESTDLSLRDGVTFWEPTSH